MSRNFTDLYGSPETAAAAPVVSAVENRLPERYVIDLCDSDDDTVSREQLPSSPKRCKTDPNERPEAPVDPPPAAAAPPPGPELRILRVEIFPDADVVSCSNRFWIAEEGRHVKSFRGTKKVEVSCEGTVERILRLARCSRLVGLRKSKPAKPLFLHLFEL